MKKLPYFLSVLLVTGLTTVATAQTAPKAHAAKSMGKMSHDYCMMMNGKMTMHPGSTKRPMMKGKADDKMGDMKM